MSQLPEWSVSRWFNTPEPLTLAGLRGKVVLVHAFQMLCPGCVMKGVPQTQRAHELFHGAGLQVVGLHTVFEHHAAMGETALEAFIHEFKLSFPIGVDTPGQGRLPVTMARYVLRGTPSTLLIDSEGHLRRHFFGGHDDMQLGAEVASLLAEAQISAHDRGAVETHADTSCNVDGECGPAATAP